MALVLEYLWQQPVYKATMIAYARDTSKFVRFVNMLINDSIHAMNESLTKLKSIKDMQAEMADEATWNAQPQRQRQQREQTLRQDEGHANYFMIFTADVLGMVKYDPCPAHPPPASCLLPPATSFFPPPPSSRLHQSACSHSCLAPPTHPGTHD